MTALPTAFLRQPLAHRALHDRADGRPENSRAAASAAIAAGYGIEIDIQQSADGHAMVFHDYDLAPLTGESGPICQRSAAELSRLALIGGNEGIPTLREMLSLVAGRAPLLIEIKDQDGAFGPKVGALERAIADDLVGYAGDIALMSINPHSMIAMAKMAPARARGLTTRAFGEQRWPFLPAATRDRLRDIPDYDAAGAVFISHEVHDLSRPRVAALKAAGAAVLCWTIRSPRAEAEARKVAQNITFEGYRPRLDAAQPDLD